MSIYKCATATYITFATIVAGLACRRSADERAMETAGSTASLDGTRWTVVELNGASVIAGSHVTLNFTGPSVGGYSGCNWYGARYTVTDTGIRIGTAESSARGCTAPVGVMQQEATLYETLRRVTSHQVIGNQLQMRNSRNEVIVALRPGLRWASNPAQLVGTGWRLQSINDGAVPPEPPVTVDFTASEIRGFAGCRDYTGTYTAHDDEIAVTSIAMATTECDSGRAALLREGQFTTDLSESAYYRVRGDSLEILTSPGRKLVFAARRMAPSLRARADSSMAALVRGINGGDVTLVGTLAAHQGEQPDTARARAAIADFHHHFRNEPVKSFVFVRQHGGEAEPRVIHFEYELVSNDGARKTVVAYYEARTDRFRLYDEFLGYSAYARSLTRGMVEALRARDATRLARLLSPDDIDYPVALAERVIASYARRFDLATLHFRFDGLAAERPGGYGPRVHRWFRYTILGTRNGARVEHPVELIHGDGLIGWRDKLVPAVNE